MTIRTKNNEIFDSVITPIAVDVMNVGLSRNPSKRLRTLGAYWIRNQSSKVLSIRSFSRSISRVFRMFSLRDSFIPRHLSFFKFCCSTPMFSFIGFTNPGKFLSFFCFPITLSRAIFSPIFVYFIRPCFKDDMTMLANTVNHKATV